VHGNALHADLGRAGLGPVLLLADPAGGGLVVVARVFDRIRGNRLDVGDRRIGDVSNCTPLMMAPIDGVTMYPPSGSEPTFIALTSAPCRPLSSLRR
jgi:hypothetical protein